MVGSVAGSGTYGISRILAALARCARCTACVDWMCSSAPRSPFEPPKTCSINLRRFVHFLIWNKNSVAFIVNGLLRKILRTNNITAREITTVVAGGSVPKDNGGIPQSRLRSVSVRYTGAHKGGSVWSPASSWRFRCQAWPTREKNEISRQSFWETILEVINFRASSRPLFVDRASFGLARGLRMSTGSESVSPQSVYVPLLAECVLILWTQFEMTLFMVFQGAAIDSWPMGALNLLPRLAVSPKITNGTIR